MRGKVGASETAEGRVSYRIKASDRSAGQALRRIAGAQLAGALSVLETPEQPGAAGLHELRRAVKRMRALLRLVKPGFAGFTREDACLREAGRKISALRDRDALLAVLDALEPDCSPELRAALAAQLGTSAGDATDALKAFHRLIDAQARRVPDWRLEDKGFDAFAPGLAAQLKAARRDLRLWQSGRDAEAMHDLRKRVKAHTHHAGLLEPIFPLLMKPRAVAMGRLGDLLGSARDHALLAERLAKLPDAEALAEKARLRARQDEKDALALARPLLAEKGKATARRWGAWWEIWRAA